MMAVSNFCETETLNFNDVVGVILSEEACRKSSGSAEKSGSALSVERRRKSMNKKKKNRKSKSSPGRSKSRSRGAGCWYYSEKGHI